MKIFFGRYLPALAWAALILLVSSIPEPLETAPSEITTYLQETEVMGVAGVTFVSLVIHFVLYVVLGLLAGRALMLKSHCNPRSAAERDKAHQLYPDNRGCLDNLSLSLIPSSWPWPCASCLAWSMSSTRWAYPAAASNGSMSARMALVRRRG